jgi:hypothetical protein
MQRKANHHECETSYDESTGRLQITYDGQHLMDIDESGDFILHHPGSAIEDVKDMRTITISFVRYLCMCTLPTVPTRMVSADLPSVPLPRS